jgi:hypothetical protein
MMRQHSTTEETRDAEAHDLLRTGSCLGVPRVLADIGGLENFPAV